MLPRLVKILLKCIYFPHIALLLWFYTVAKSMCVTNDPLDESWIPSTGQIVSTVEEVERGTNHNLTLNHNWEKCLIAKLTLQHPLLAQ